jgi:hypothetical protein
MYFLNGTRCRRKDVKDLFLGTGLGSRSYSIIEQGMISEVVEARPEEIRGHLEEAAGISRYKERRRETERRIQHTRDNLARLSDLREEVGKHLGRLKRQAPPPTAIASSRPRSGASRRSCWCCALQVSSRKKPRRKRCCPSGKPACKRP